MNDYTQNFISLTWRGLLAAPFFYVCITGRASILSPVFGAIGALIVAFPLARLLGEFSGNLYWPGRRFDRPQPMYGIPQSRRAKGLYEEAIAGFEEIADRYPDELQPHIEMIEIAIVNLKDPDRAAAYYQRGLSRLKKSKDKEALTRMYEAIRTRLNARPDR